MLAIIIIVLIAFIITGRVHLLIAGVLIVMDLIMTVLSFILFGAVFLLWLPINLLKPKK